MFESYIKAVMRLYDMKKRSGELSLNLTQPTPANLKNECIVIFKKKCSKDDLHTLKSFLGYPLQEEIYLSSIRVFDRDKFKPLRNFLQKDVTHTHDKNIELLAWMIDFSPRPYFRYCKWLEAQNNSEADRILQGELVLSEAMKMASKQRGTTCLIIQLKERGILRSLVENAEVETSYFGIKRSCRIRAMRPTGSDPITTSFGESMECHNLEQDGFTVLGKHAENTLNSSLEKSQQHSKMITLEYPSGVKLSVDVCDLELISKLVKL